jgi:SAM-dependent methyltransferase
MEDTGPSNGASRRTVLGGITLTALAAASGAGQAMAQAGGAATPWKQWWTRDYRIVQTNLREIDVLRSPRDIAKAVKDFGGTAIVSNIGGIVAFYPTKLELQHTNPHLKGDFVKEMIEASHAEGLAYLGRFDTSKALKPVYDAHPDWFSVHRDGQPTEYAGTYQVCPNGAWLQDYALRILREALTAYKPDGVFFNGLGFGVNDYAGRTRGSCVCNNCRAKFRAMYGLELPVQEGFSDPNWRPYLEFQERVVAELNARTKKLADELIPDAAIFRGDDYEYVGRGEMQRRVRRPAPEWPYQAGEQARGAVARNPGKPFSSTSTAHIDYPWRQVTETADYHITRFAQQLASGARLDLYLMGTLADQDDQSYLPPVSQLFKWQAANSQHYLRPRPAARVGLYDSEANQRFAAATPWATYRAGSTRGAYSALVDSRLPFHFVNGERVVEGVTKLSDFDVIVAPHVLCMSDQEAAALDAFVSAGGLLIASGMTAGFDVAGRPRSAMPLASFPIAAYGEPQKAEGWVLDSAKGALKHSTNPTPVDAYYFGGTLRSGTTDLLPFIPDIRWGPPEYSYIVPGSKARTIPGVAVRTHGQGHAVHIPWLNDWQYYRDGLQVNQQLLAALVARYAPAQPFALTGKGPVELTATRTSDRNVLLHVINYGGQRNGRYDTPPELHGLSVGARGAFTSARSLVTGRALTASTRPGDTGRRWFDLPPVGAFDAILLQG